MEYKWFNVIKIEKVNDLQTTYVWPCGNDKTHDKSLVRSRHFSQTYCRWRQMRNCSRKLLILFPGSCVTFVDCCCNSAIIRG